MDTIIKNSIKTMPEEDRPREKMLEFGSEALTNGELLAIIIGFGSKEDSAISLSQKILHSNGRGLINIAEADLDTLKAFKGINTAKACKIMAVSELSKRISTLSVKKTKVTSPFVVASLLKEEMRYLKKEVFKVVHLDTKNNIIGITDVSVGCLDSTVVHPREVFVDAVKKSTAGIILVHNHPSGEVDPSKQDIDLTNRIIICGNIIGIKVLDHIIIGDENYLSFKESNLMNDIQNKKITEAAINAANL